MTNNETSTQQLPLSRECIIPQTWIADPNSAVWISGYVVIGLSPNSFSQGMKDVLLDETKVLFLYGQINYIGVTELGVVGKQTPEFHSRVDQKTSPESGYLLIIQKFDKNRLSDLEEAIRERLRIIGGFIAAIIGQNAIYHHLFDNIADLQNNDKTIIGKPFKNPLTLSGPNIDDTQFQLLAKGYENAKKLPENERNRVYLSLQWYLEAINASGIDLFLKNWFAIEALGMSDRENILPINSRLARAYGISISEAKQLFEVGRLYGFRNKIVHQGKRYLIYSQLSDYVEALYLDLLFECLGLECEKRAETIKRCPEFDLKKLIYSE